MERKIEDIRTDVLAGEPLSPEDRERWEKWLEEDANRQEFYRLLDIRSAIWMRSHSQETDPEKGWKRFMQRIRPRRRLSRIYPAAAAAAVLAVVSSLALLYRGGTDSPADKEASLIGPGRHAVILELADGQKFDLVKTGRSGQRIKENIRLDSCSLDYLEPSGTVAPVPNRLSVPRGGEYQLRLSDGTRVWLNSETVLEYPEHFPENIREVRLEGEAYFEVAPDKDRPFLIHSPRQEVRVLGTAFGITGYADDTVTLTTLVRGSVEVLLPGGPACILQPGEQARYSRRDGRLERVRVDTREFTGWKDGTYLFRRKRLEDVLSTLSRWYDFKVFYLNREAKDYLLSGEVERFRDFNTLLDMIARSTGLQFSILGNTVTVSL